MVAEAEKQGDERRALWFHRPRATPEPVSKARTFGGLMRLMEETLAEDLARVQAERQLRREPR